MSGRSGFARWLLARFGASVAFGVPGVLMAVATGVFWLGRWQFAHVPPAGLGVLREALQPQALSRLGQLAVLYALIAIFWSLFDQTGSSWVLQAAKLDREIGGHDILPSQIQAANPFLILLLVPFCSRVVYPALERWVPLNPLRKIGLGMTLAAASFAVVAMIQDAVDHGATPNIAWQLLAYVLLTSAEVMVSVTGLEFAYTQAPLTMKSLVMAFYMASVALGNVFTSAVNFLITMPDGGSRLAGARYFWFFCVLMAVTTLIYAVYARRYRAGVHLQPDQPAP
jgi:POT family proton-dependent oligopeptide transporter